MVIAMKKSFDMYFEDFADEESLPEVYQRPIESRVVVQHSRM